MSDNIQTVHPDTNQAENIPEKARSSIHFDHNNGLLKNLKRGQALEFKRKKKCAKSFSYSHLGIYVDNCEVVDVHGDAKDAICDSNVVYSACGCVAFKAEVKKRNFWTVAEDSQVELAKPVSNLKELDLETIARKAEAEVGNKFAYNVFINNCEHFVNQLRYNKAISTQVPWIVVALVGFAGISAGFMRWLIDLIPECLANIGDSLREFLQRKAAHQSRLHLA